MRRYSAILIALPEGVVREITHFNNIRDVLNWIENYVAESSVSIEYDSPSVKVFTDQYGKSFRIQLWVN